MSHSVFTYIWHWTKNQISDMRELCRITPNFLHVSYTFPWNLVLSSTRNVQEMLGNVMYWKAKYVGNFIFGPVWIKVGNHYINNNHMTILCAYICRLICDSCATSICYYIHINFGICLSQMHAHNSLNAHTLTQCDVKMHMCIHHIQPTLSCTSHSPRNWII